MDFITEADHYGDFDNLDRIMYLYMVIITLYSYRVTVLTQAIYLYCKSPKSFIDIKNELVMRKPAFCICENKDADQLFGNSEDQFSHNEAQIMLL